MAVRLVWMAHGMTTGMRALTFGDESSLIEPKPDRRSVKRTATCSCGPEAACVETAEALGVQATVDDRLAGLDTGSWRGHTLALIADRSPEDLACWLADPQARPHGGESFADLVQRVGAVCDNTEWGPGTHLLVVHPTVARAAAVHALDVSADAIFRLEVAPLGRVTMSRSKDRWRLLGLG